MFQLAGAQNNSASLTTSQGLVPIPVSAASSTPDTPPVSTTTATEPVSTQIAIIDYKSVYETATIEEEVKMATERFNLTPSQQDMWLVAATDRRATEKQAQEKLDSKAANYEKDGIYRGLRSAQNTFYETIIGYLSPVQKQALETDRLIMEEKRKKLAKLPPPTPAPTVTVAPVDSAAIKETEKSKVKSKKSKKKKKAVG
jgi:1,2-phenylacetyl-CoA epoxidase PaaB subunit